MLQKECLINQSSRSTEGRVWADCWPVLTLRRKYSPPRRKWRGKLMRMLIALRQNELASVADDAGKEKPGWSRQRVSQMKAHGICKSVKERATGERNEVRTARKGDGESRRASADSREQEGRRGGRDRGGDENADSYGDEDDVPRREMHLSDLRIVGKNTRSGARHASHPFAREHKSLRTTHIERQDSRLAPG